MESQMSLTGFGILYMITAELKATKRVFLTTDMKNPIQSGELEEVEDMVRYTVWNLHNEPIFTYETEDEELFLEALIEEFNLKVD